MTNEDIEKAIGETFDGFSIEAQRITARHSLTVTVDEYTDSSDLQKDVVARARALVSQALGEAVRIVESWDTGNNGDHCDEAAAEIRALKDSLSVETVSI